MDGGSNETGRCDKGAQCNGGEGKSAMGEPQIRFIQFASADDVAAETARRIGFAADRAIAQRHRFRCLLAGGRTPLAAYARLVEEPQAWSHWHLFLGDERCLPPEDPERNSLAIAHALTDRVPVPREQCHWIAAELGPEAAAKRYESAIATHLPFDLVLLGMGEDGHTASLFPGHPVPPERKVMAVYGAPKPPSERVSLTPLALAEAPERLVLVTGSSKRDALAAWRAGEDLPVARVAALGPTIVLKDAEAAGA
jgi:6-phosphogluconolactonase